jgi:hypothetical protein
MAEPDDQDRSAEDKRVPRQPEVQDPLVRRMITLGIPVTRANYLSLTAPEADPSDLDAEMEASLPPELRLQGEGDE